MTAWAPTWASRSAGSTDTVARPWTRMRHGRRSSTKSSSDAPVIDDVAQRAPHPVAVIARDPQFARAHDSDKSDVTTLVRHVRPPVRVDCRDPHRRLLADQLDVAGIELVMHRDRREGVREPLRIERLLQRPSADAVQVPAAEIRDFPLVHTPPSRASRRRHRRPQLTTFGVRGQGETLDDHHPSSPRATDAAAEPGTNSRGLSGR